MTTAAIAATEEFQIGRVFSRTFSVIGRNFLSFLLLAALMTVPSILLTFWAIFARALGINVTLWTPGTVAAVVGGGVAGFVIYFVFTNLLQAALTHGTIVTLNGGRASFIQCLGTGLRNALPLTLLVILASLGIALGFVLLIVPGIILALAWAVITPVRVAEHPEMMATFGRSAALTKGHRGSIFVVNLVIGIISFALTFAIRPLAGIEPSTAGHIPVTFIAVSALVQIVQYMIGATAVASVYYELRVVKEGVGPEQLAAVFD